MSKTIAFVGLVAGSLLAGCGSTKPTGQSSELVSGGRGATPAPAVDTLTSEERRFVGRWRIDMSKIVAQAAEAAKKGKGGYGEAIAYLPSIMLDVRADHTVLLSGISHVGTGTWSVSGDTMSFEGPRVLSALTFTLTGGVAKMNIESGSADRPADRYEMLAEERGPAIDGATLPGLWEMDLRASASSMKRMAEQSMALMEAMMGQSLGQPVRGVEEYEAQLRQAMPRTPKLRLSADGKGQMSDFGGTTDFAWSVWDDILVLREGATGKGEPTVLTLVNTKEGLELEMGMMSMVFKKK